MSARTAGSLSRSFLALGALAAALAAQGDKSNAFQQADGTISFKPGAGTTFDGGDEFKLTLLTYVQLQYSDTWGDEVEDDQNFRVRRARPAMFGHAYRKDLLYTLRLDLTDSGSVLKDAWVQWDFLREEDSRIGLRTGQSKTYFGLETTETDSALFFVDRTVVSTTFSDARSRGLWLHGNQSNKLRWTVGAQNGDVAASNPAGIQDVGEEDDNSDNELAYVASLNVDPLGDYVGNGASYESFREGDLANTQELRGTVGLGLFQGNSKLVTDPTGRDVTSNSINLNTSWKLKSFWTQAEWFQRHDDIETGDRDGNGFYLGFGYVLPKSGDKPLQWGIGGRIADVDQEGGTDTRDWTMVLSSFYRGHTLKTQLEYTWRERDPATGGSQDGSILRLQFQVVF
ncbi:MAG: hypothetical protein RIT25_764 [Planctomycetota bacterium]